MSSTTEILSRIETDFKKQKSLEAYLPNLVQSLNSSKKIVFTNMNAKQKLTQLQSLIQAELSKIQTSLSEQKIDLEAEQEPVEQAVSEQVQQEMEDEEGQVEGQQFEEEDEQNEDIEQDQNEEEQEFAQPDFTHQNKKGKRKHQEEEMIDEEDQNQQGQYDDEQMGQNEQVQEDEQDFGELQGEDEEPFDEEDDVGLYGEELNENDEDLQNYQNQYDEEEFKQFEKQFGESQAKNSKKSKSKKPRQDENEEDDPDDHVEDNFDHFRQIQLQNQKAEVQTTPKTQLDDQIDRLQNKIVGKKDWAMKGQIKARQRPANSLLEYDLQFSSGIKYSHEITEQRNSELEELIKKRILSDMFDDRTRFVNASHIREHFGSLKEVSREKSKMGLGEVYESQFKNFLGIGENKNDKLKTQIMDSFKELNYYLDSLSNFSFVPKPTKDTTKKGQSEAIIVEEKVPLTLWNGQKEVQKDNKHRFESEKQVDNQAKRLKNKRIARQRKKEQMKKRLNKKIEYGGITKFEAQAKQKAQMNNKPLKVDGVNMKYNKSTSFFKNINENKGGKPNPDISKMKI